MSAPLWALCASITQALELLETDSEKGEGGDVESLKSPIAASPPLDNSVTEGEGPLCDNVSHGKESEIQKELQPVVQLLQQILQLQLSPPKPSPPPTPVLLFPWFIHPHQYLRRRRRTVFPHRHRQWKCCLVQAQFLLFLLLLPKL